MGSMERLADEPSVRCPPSVFGRQRRQASVAFCVGSRFAPGRRIPIPESGRSAADFDNGSGRRGTNRSGRVVFTHELEQR